MKTVGRSRDKCRQNFPDSSEHSFTFMTVLIHGCELSVFAVGVTHSIYFDKQESDNGKDDRVAKVRCRNLTSGSKQQLLINTSSSNSSHTNSADSSSCRLLELIKLQLCESNGVRNSQAPNQTSPQTHASSTAAVGKKLSYHFHSPAPAPPPN